VTLYQVGDIVEGGSFNTFLDALDLTYCTSGGGDTPGMQVVIFPIYAYLNNTFEVTQAIRTATAVAQKHAELLHLHQLSAHHTATTKQISRPPTQQGNATST
jgi:hypothetical protein